jgi:hypothetical protein
VTCVAVSDVNFPWYCFVYLLHCIRTTLLSGTLVPVSSSTNIEMVSGFALTPLLIVPYLGQCCRLPLITDSHLQCLVLHATAFEHSVGSGGVRCQAMYPTLVVRVHFVLGRICACQH